MGWLYGHDTRESLVRHLSNPARISAGFTLLKTRIVGARMWQLIRKEDTGERFIHLNLMQGRNGPYGWGYKDMSEHSGPYYYDCPLSLIDEATAPANDTAREWREKVRAYHAMKRAASKPAPGISVTHGGTEYRLDQPRGPRRGWNVTRVSDGMQFRMNARILSEALRAQVQA